MPNSTALRSDLTVRSPADVIALIPYLLGFHPAMSLVLLGLDGPDGACAARLDIPTDSHDPPDPDGMSAGIGHLVDVLIHREATFAIMVGYGPGDRVTPAVDMARGFLTDSDLPLLDALRVEDNRYWSYLCTEPGCCPVDGTPFDIASSAVAAQATAHGLVALARRSELDRIVAEAIEDSARGAVGEAERLFAERLLEQPDSAGDRMIGDGLAHLRRLLDRAAADEDPPSDSDVAWLGIFLTHLRVRDEAWVRIDDAPLDALVAFWADVVRRSPDPYVVGPACLLAYAAWRNGDGALANVALDRALTASPEYSMAHLLHELFDSGLPPSTTLGMTPDQLNEEWADEDSDP